MSRVRRGARAPETRERSPLRTLFAGPELEDARRAVEYSFERMKEAEDEIRRKVHQLAGKPEAQRRVWNSFPLLAPPESLRRFTPALYVWHVRELLERRALDPRRAPREEWDTRTATKVEVLAAVSSMSLKSRLDHDVELLGLRLADEFFPNMGLVDGGEREDYPGSVAAKFRELAERLRVSERLVLESDEREIPEHFWEDGR